jgi:hypothetical protein
MFTSVPFRNLRRQKGGGFFFPKNKFKNVLTAYNRKKAGMPPKDSTTLWNLQAPLRSWKDTMAVIRKRIPPKKKVKKAVKKAAKLAGKEMLKFGFDYLGNRLKGGNPYTKYDARKIAMDAGLNMMSSALKGDRSRGMMQTQLRAANRRRMLAKGSRPVSSMRSNLATRLERLQKYMESQKSQRSNLLNRGHTYRRMGSRTFGTGAAGRPKGAGKRRPKGAGKKKKKKKKKKGGKKTTSFRAMNIGASRTRLDKIRDVFSI